MDPIARMQVLTRRDLSIHARAMEKLRRCLFRHRQQSDCCIIDVEVVLPPRVHVLVSLATGKPSRHLTCGGLEYTLMFPHARAPHRIGVQHWEADLFWLHATFTDPVKHATYTRFSTTVPFQTLSEVFLRCIDQLALECKPLNEPRLYG